MLHTTFAIAKEGDACTESYKKMAKALGGIKAYGKDTPIPLDKILEVCGLDDALWSLRITVEDTDRERRLLACDYAERVLPIFEKKYPTDDRPRNAILVARRFANGEATETERAAASAAWDAGDAAWAAAWDARDAARAAAASAARAAAGDAEREWQTQRFREFLNEYK